jgi:hypothetical protein
LNIDNCVDGSALQGVRTQESSDIELALFCSLFQERKLQTKHPIMPSTKRKSPEDDNEEQQQHDEAGGEQGGEEDEEDDPETEAAVEAAMGDADMSIDGGDIHHGEISQNPDVKRAAVGGDAQWNAMLFQLVFFKAVHGDLRPKPKDEEHKPLYDWMVAQRKEFKIYQDTPDRSFLTPDQVKVLDHLQFPWNTRGDDHWIRNFEHLKQFCNEHGHCMVPRTFVDVPNLCHWVTDQRRQLKNLKLGKPSTMTKDRQRLLDEIGFVWQVRNRTTWDMRFAELLEFKEQKGTTVVPQREYIQNLRDARTRWCCWCC